MINVNACVCECSPLESMAKRNKYVPTGKKKTEEKKFENFFTSDAT